MSEYSNTSTGTVSSFNKGMVRDINEGFLGEGMWTYALNATNASHRGDKGTLGNEASNELYASAPYTVIGIVHKKGYEYVVFSTDDSNSEIGIFEESTKTYRKVVNDPGLNFKKKNLITGVCKRNYDCTDSVYFQDGENPDRVINLDNVPYLKSGNNLSPDEDCVVPEYTDKLDVDALRLHPLMQIPSVQVKRGQGSGQLPSGSYQAVVAYSESGVRLTDYSIPSNPQPIWNHSGIGGSIEVVLEGLDETFDEYELVIISVVNQQTVAKKIGHFSTRQKTVHLDQINAALPTVPIADIPLRSPVYEKSDKMFEVGPYLIRTGLTSQKYFNYQPQANNIRARWVAVSYPEEYYKQGGNNAGYMRDEVYSFFIRWVYLTGHRSASFHIPGRTASGTDMQPVTGSRDIVSDNEKYRWQVYDTSTSTAASGTLADGGRITAKGDMSYWESTEKYPDNKPEIWGELCGKPIRHHKFPSNEVSHIHNDNGEIFIMGVEFDNITHPVDEHGKPIKEIVGYEILRGSREGNRSVVAKGLFNNMWEYDLQPGIPTSKRGFYQNYPYNDLNPDRFLVENPLTLEKGNGSNKDVEAFPPVSSYRKDFFSFHSPETTFDRPFLGSNHVKIYKEQICTISGKYEVPYNHPKHKMITDGALGAAGLVGAGLAMINVFGKVTTGSTLEAGINFIVKGGGSATISRESGVGSIAGDIIRNSITANSILGNISATALLVSQSAYFLLQGASTVLDTIYSMISFRNYVLQFNSHGFYNRHTNIVNPESMSGGKAMRRKVHQGNMKYMGSGIHDFDVDMRINNLNRNKFVAIRTEDELPNPSSTAERSRIRIQDGMGLSHKNPFVPLTMQGVSYYGAIKLEYSSQYGQLQSVVQVPVESNVRASIVDVNTKTSTGPLFGGDVYINRYTEKNPFYYFNSWMYELPDGFEFDYRNYVNGPIPRYWANFSRFDVDDFKLKLKIGKTKSSGSEDAQKKAFEKEMKKIEGKNIVSTDSPSKQHRFDRKGDTGAFALKNCWMYIFNNGVRDFYVESEINLAFRDYGEDDDKKFYDPFGEVLTDLSTIFRSDIITKPIYHKYDLSLSASKLYNNFASWGNILPRDFDPGRYSSCFEYLPKRAVYSLPHREGLRRDNWRNFLAANYKDFTGRVSSIKPLNRVGAVILFEDDEPVQFVGQDTFQSAGGVKYSVGDGGLFQQAMQSMVNADDAMGYASCQSSRSVVNTPHGLFWISQNSGKIFRFTGNVEDITRLGMKHWFSEFLPSRLLEKYPHYPLADNPVAGIGCQAVYDAQYELVYFTKKDYVPLRDDLLIDEDGRFYIEIGEVQGSDCSFGSSVAESLMDDCEFGGYELAESDGKIVASAPQRSLPTVRTPAPAPVVTPSEKLKQYISLDNEEYFIPCNWTVSFDPKENVWVSYHSWTPTLLAASHEHFFTVMEKSFWKHNKRTDSFGNFYGTDYPFEVEATLNTPGTVTTLRSIEYILEVFKYKNEGRDTFHILDENFDQAVIYNSEQTSGKLKLVPRPKNNPVALLGYPKMTPNWIEVLFSKEENRYRFNQFWDIIKDRGEFTEEDQQIWINGPDGVSRYLNPDALDYQKHPLQRKKFRHYGNKLLLTKASSKDKKMILKLLNSKNLFSSR